MSRIHGCHFLDLRICRFIGFLPVLMLFAMTAVSQQVPGWEPQWPSPQKVFDGCPPQILKLFYEQNAILLSNPRDEGALVNRAVYGLKLARTSRYNTFLVWLAAKDLEQAVQLDPNDYTAWHNYGNCNYLAGDYWMLNDHSNGLRAVRAFTRAIQLNPSSARTYMGRGWAYYDMYDPVRAKADFDKALQLDPSLRPELEKEVRNIDDRHAQVVAARMTLNQLGRYYVDTSSRNEQACSRARCSWMNGECRCSLAFYPGN